MHRNDIYGQVKPNTFKIFTNVFQARQHGLTAAVITTIVASRMMSLIHEPSCIFQQHTFVVVVIFLFSSYLKLQTNFDLVSTYA